MAVKAKAEITLSHMIDIVGNYRYYLLQSSTASIPAKPTTFPPSSAWNDTEPTYTSGSTNSLYFVDCSVYSNGTFYYSPVSLSTAYESAKEAYNKAVNAQNSANNAQNTADSKNTTYRGAGVPNYTGTGNPEPLFTNLVENATTDVGGTEIYDVDGYADDMRWSSSSGVAKEYDTARLTGWMPYIAGATYRIKNMGMSYVNVATSGVYVDGYYFITSNDGALVTNAYSAKGQTDSVVDAENDLITFTKSLEGNFFRISGYKYDANSELLEAPIITCNEEIAYGEVGATGNPNSPSVQWKLDGTEEEHVGDLYIDTETGYLYRWDLYDDVYEWQRVKDGDIESNYKELQQTVTEQHASIIESCEGYILNALKTYTETRDFDTFKQTTESALQFLSNQMTLKFEESTEQIKNVNNDLQEKYNTITKHFKFDVNGLTIGQGESPFKVVIDNDRYSMFVNGVEVLWLDPDGKSCIPSVTVTTLMNLLGYVIDADSNSQTINCGWGGE